MKDSLLKAEKNAKLRDVILKDLQEPDFDKLPRLEKEANKYNYTVIKEKSVNRAEFAQVINSNIKIINKEKYLTGSELGFITSILPYLEYQINAIRDIENDSFMTISEIANKLGKARTGVSRMISSLIDKGVMFEFVNAKELKKFNRNVTSRTLFLNPELFYMGDRNKIDGTLATLVSEYDVLEDNGIKLEWKVYKKSGHTFGRLYHRKSYLNFKRTQK